MKKWFGFLSVWAAAGAAVGSAFAAEQAAVQSPDGTVEFRVSVGAKLTYQISRRGQAVLVPSDLGLEFKGQKPYGEMRIAAQKAAAIDEPWTNRLGKNRAMRNRANEVALNLVEVSEPRRKLDLVFRAYDSGAAFRYGIPAQPGFETFVLTADKTTYAFADNPIGWFTTYPDYTRSQDGSSKFAAFKSSQEEPFFPQSLRTLDPKRLIGCPMVIQTAEDCWVAISEADLTDWAGSFYVFQPDKQPVNGAVLATWPSPRFDGNGLVVSAAPRLSPWRAFILGDSEVDLVNHNDLIPNLNPPCADEAAFSWVTPGASAWDWWVFNNKELTTDKIKEKVDFAKAMGWPFITVDAPWYGRPVQGEGVSMMKPRADLDIEGAIGYARSQGIGVYLWGYWSTLESNGVENVFSVYEKWGVRGVKIDFMDRQDQEMVNWYSKVVECGARHKIMVNFHGAFKPTGMSRTWPNQITREGILGNEFNKFSKKVTVTHCATLPFTRYLLGPGDFTPGGFNNVHGEAFTIQTQKKGWAEGQYQPVEEMGTRAHALALCLIYDSPLMTLCDWPEHYRGQPGVEFLKELPTVWDETVALAGKIGQYYVSARRKGAVWYLGAVTDVHARTLAQPLSFLGDGTYEATVFADSTESDQDAKAILVRKQSVSAKDVLSMPLARDGGMTVIFRKR